MDVIELVLLWNCWLVRVLIRYIVWDGIICLFFVLKFLCRWGIELVICLGIVDGVSKIFLRFVRYSWLFYIFCIGLVIFFFLNRNRGVKIGW